MEERYQAKDLSRLDKFKLDSTFISVNGDLKVLDKVSKNSSPFVYGDLAIENTRRYCFQW